MDELKRALEMVATESYQFKSGKFKYWDTKHRSEMSAFDSALGLCRAICNHSDRGKLFDLVKVIAGSFGWRVVRPILDEQEWTDRSMIDDKGGVDESRS